LRDQHVRIFAQRFADEEFKLAGFVAAGRQPGAIVALDENPRPSQQFRQPRHRFDRSRLVAQVGPRETIEFDPGALARQSPCIGHGIFLKNLMRQT